MSKGPKDSGKNNKNKKQNRKASKKSGATKTRVRSDLDSGKKSAVKATEKETLLKQEIPNDDETNFRPRPDDVSEATEDTEMFVRRASAKTVLRGESEDDAAANMTVLRKPVQADPANVTVLRPPAEVETAVRVEDEEKKKAKAEAAKAEEAPTKQADEAPQQLTDEDITVVPESDDEDDTLVPDDDSTIVPGGTTRPSAPHAAGGAKGAGSEAGRLLKNRYVLEEKIGSGGMADVYKALDLRQQEAEERNPYIAIKILNDRFAQHKQAYLSLQREATRTRNIPHPNIMGVYDFDKEGDTIFMSMELLAGKPMDDWLKDHKDGVPREDALRVIDDICKGLGRAHDAGIIHADFKPGNIYYCSDGSAKVFDFGIARLEGEDEDVFDAGTLGALTPTYASYEMLKGLTPSKSDDVYAVALTAYELLTGKHPYDRVAADKAYDREMKLTPIPWMKRRHWKTLEKALQFKSEDRTQGLDEFREGMFSEDPPYALYSGMAAALVLSVGFGLYQAAKDAPIPPEEFVNLSGDFTSNSASIDTLLGVAGAPTPDDWNFQSSVWRGQLDTNLLKMKLDNILLHDDHSDWITDEEIEANQEVIVGHQNQVMAAYLAEMKNSRRQAQQAVVDPDDKLQVEDALVILNRANIYLGVTQTTYNFDADKIESEADSLGQATDFREYQLATIIRNAEEAEAAELAAIKAEEDRNEAQRIFDENWQRYEDHLAEFRDILRCKGEIVPEKLASLEKTIKGFREYPERFEVDRAGFTAALQGCIEQRIAVRKPDDARNVQAIVATYLPEDADIFKSIKIIDLDPCAGRGLAGKGSLGRNKWCADKLATGGTGPQLVVIPEKTGLSEGKVVVEIAKFATSRLEIRIRDYNQYCIEDGCSQLVGEADLPATNISFDQAGRYLAWLSDNSGETYRLPTKEEWLYAATTDKAGEIDKNINCTVDSRGVRLGENLQKAERGVPNGWGLFHYVGNAREWVVNGDDIRALGGAHTDPRPECTLDKSVSHSGQADPVTGFRVVREFKTKLVPASDA